MNGWKLYSLLMLVAMMPGILLYHSSMMVLYPLAIMFVVVHGADNLIERYYGGKIDRIVKLIEDDWLK